MLNEIEKARKLFKGYQTVVGRIVDSIISMLKDIIELDWIFMEDDLTIWLKPKERSGKGWITLLDLSIHNKKYRIPLELLIGYALPELFKANIRIICPRRIYLDRPTAKKIEKRLIKLKEESNNESNKTKRKRNRFKT